MKSTTNGRIIDFDSEFKSIDDSLTEGIGQIENITSDINETQKEILQLKQLINGVIKDNMLPIEQKDIVFEDWINEFNKSINNLIRDIGITKGDRLVSKKKFPTLSITDLIVCATSGIVATLVDVILVGAPDIRKLSNGKEVFEGSILTEWLRSIGKNEDSKFAEILTWFSNKCKVPYDISLVSGVVTPNNHRLRNFAHDPLFGLLFALADIVLGTTTCIDNQGCIKVLINKNKADLNKKYLAVVFYLGHLISDICTSRGLPIPGWALTQFFTAGEPDSTIAKITERMYIDGYDTRHLMSMSLPVVISNSIVSFYADMTYKKNDMNYTFTYEKEISDIEFKLIKHKMVLITNAIGSVGNVVKVIVPPNSGDLTAINLPQWSMLLNESLVCIRAAGRDMSTENIISNREQISAKWMTLIKDL